jgi:hypothetical protein
VSHDSHFSEREPFPGSAAQAPTSPEVNAGERELRHLRSLQIAAISDATYLGMTAKEAQTFEQRSQRIKEIIIALGRNET